MTVLSMKAENVDVKSLTDYITSQFETVDIDTTVLDSLMMRPA